MNHGTKHSGLQALTELLAAQAGVPLSTDDILLLVLPLFKQVTELHAHGKVAILDSDSILLTDEGGLALRNPAGAEPHMAIDAVRRIQPHAESALNIIGTLQLTHVEGHGEYVSEEAVQIGSPATIERPVYLPGPGSWELVLGHHDEITDVFMLGMALASLACGLDFSDVDELQRFVAYRRNLFHIHARLNPIVASVIVEMTEINRHERATDVASLATRLRTWRGQPEGLDVERVLAGATEARPRRTAVLGHLRDRLFDLSRRNRLLHFRPTAATVNLTIASVPLVLQVNSVRAEQICTWNLSFAGDVLSGKQVNLQRWLRFEDQPYLPGVLDKLIAETRRDRAEYGFSNLRLVLAFLRWHNLKEAPDERIVTPLLWLPADLVKRKGVRDQYTLQCAGSEAEFNPVLRHQLNQLYGIRLPETVDLEKTTIEQVHADIRAQIQRSEQGVELRLIEKPSIRMVRQKAMQRMQQYQRRKPAAVMARGTGWLPPFSYAAEDYRPLGRAMFEHWVRPSDLPQRFEAGAAPRGMRQPAMIDVAEEADERQGYVLEEQEGHRYAWDLDLTQITLANLNYKKMSLVRDYTQLIDSGSANPSFDKVFSIEPREVDAAVPSPLSPDEQWNVVSSDATQDAAVALARKERSFIIQGPPGTGKSQTIANLIADYAGQGKRVLFVCEKRAALDVVFHRLKQSQLDALCCLIHDSQSDKKAFIADLKHCYEGWIGLADQSTPLLARRAMLTANVKANKQLLDEFEAAMSAQSALVDMPVRSLLRRIVELPPVPEAGHALRERLPSMAAWGKQSDLAHRVHREMQERFGMASLAAHPFAKLAAGLVLDEHAYSRAEKFCQSAETLFAALDAAFENKSTLITLERSLRDAVRTAADSKWLIDKGLAGHLDLLDASGAARVELSRRGQQLQASEISLARAAEATAHWRDKLTRADTESALEQVNKLEPSLLRWLQPAWWRLRGELNRRYDLAKHAVHPSYRKILEQLAAEHSALAAVKEADEESCGYYGVGSMRSFLQDVALLEQRLGSADGIGELVSHLRRAPDALAAARLEASFLIMLDQLAQLTSETLALDEELSLGSMAELVRDLREALDDLPDLLPVLRSVHQGDAACAGLLQKLDCIPAQLEALVADEAMRKLERETPILARFGGVALAQAARALEQNRRELLSVNAQLVLANRHRQFGENVRLSSLSVTQLDSSGKAFKKQYATGRRELEHEFGKTMRHRSIRDLSDDETGLVVNDLKPIWLMSPLSVSDTLPLSTDLFDVVIFDEASQIPTEEAVPALSRAKQVIVVGDEMQLPPTNFFTASSATEDNEIVVEEEGERIAICLDSDSLLNQASRNLPATLLAWHYRSRHESLISFSNAAFYDGRLVTIPDRKLEQDKDEVLRVRSDQQDAGAAGCDAVHARPISFHRISDGVYSDRRNAAEARYIAEVVREMLRREGSLSLGIVAFSEAQQSEIESALEALAEKDADFAARLEREYVREDDDQFNGLFVKNLENVQGDERDVIILSICYAPGPDGKMLMNFGPINQRGGEKRLNVIFSRARHRMAVVSSIQAEAITNVHNDGAAALRTFLQFAQASAAGHFESAQATLGALNQGAKSAFTRDVEADSIRDALATALRARGHEVHVNVGRSQLRCDLGIVDASTQEYALAILLDRPGESVADTVERYTFRPGILRNFGWKVLDVPGKDWISDPQALLARIESILKHGEDRALENATAILPIPPIPALPAVVQAAASPTQAMPAVPEVSPDVVRALEFEQGASRKFWTASVRSNDLSVRYGRIGSDGQVILKQFESPERARRELEKLVAEKLRKGYVEVGPK
jgi:predicted DNA-binding WGR domain protein